MKDFTFEIGRFEGKTVFKASDGKATLVGLVHLGLNPDRTVRFYFTVDREAVDNDIQLKRIFKALQHKRVVKRVIDETVLDLC